MSANTPQNLVDRYSRGVGKRNFRRRAQFALESNFGPVLDLSVGGLRLIAKRALDGVQEVTLQAPGVEHKMKARVVWCKKVGFRVYEVGMEFTDRQAVQHLVQWIAVWSGKPGSR